MSGSLAMFIIIYALLALCGLEHVGGMSVHNLHRRDAPLVTVNIPLTVNQNLRYVVGVNMSSSADTQNFNFVLAANTGYNAVAGVACDNCNNVPAYNASASTSQKPFPGSKNLTIGIAYIVGNFIKENCGLHEVNGSAWQYPNQTIIVANSSTLFSNVTSGLIGLGTNAMGASGDFYDTIFGGWLTRNPSRNNFSFGMALQTPTFSSNSAMGSGGILHWVVPDPSAYEGDVTWTNASVAATAADTPTGNESDTVPNSPYTLPESDWIIPLDGWSASIANAAVANTNSAQAIIEPFFPNINFPVSQANSLYASVSNAVKLNSLVNGAQVWSLPCDSPLTVSFTFAGQSFPIGPENLIIPQPDGSCVGAIQAWSDSTVSNFLMGSNFISALYLIFVVGRPGSGVPNSVGMARRSTPAKTSHVGAIVGGTIGGVVVLVILLVGAYLLGRMKGSKHDAGQQTVPVLSGRVREKDDIDHDRYTDEDAQFVTLPPSSAFSSRNSRPHNPPTPLSAASSSHPLLPEVQSPLSPAFGVPYTPVSPMNFRPISSSGGPRTSVVSYNSSNLGANVSASHYAPPSAGADRQDFGIEPYVVSSAPSPSMQLGMPRDYKIQHWHPTRSQSSDQTSLQDLDPLSPSTVSATIEPYVLAPPPQGALIPSSKARPTPVAVQRSETQTPAPAYSLHGGNGGGAGLQVPVSPTLVNYSPTADQERSHRLSGST